MSGLLHPFPSGTPTDAELQAQRDADHAAVIASWRARGECFCLPIFMCRCGANAAKDDPFGDERDDEAVSA